MKIERNIKHTSFQDLEDGQAFMYNAFPSTTYVKCRPPSKGGPNATAFRIEGTAFITQFPDETRVVPLNATLVVE